LLQIVDGCVAGASSLPLIHPFEENAVRNLKRFGLAIVALGLFGGGVYRADDKDSADPKYTIKQVMKMAHGKADKSSPSLSDKVLSGKATDDEKTKLLEMYVAMAANKPPKGELEAWKDRTGAIVAAIKSVQDGKENADVDLRKAMSCSGCHSSHRRGGR
jgi:hypothetical protein